MKPLRSAIAVCAFGAIAGCNGLIGVKDIFSDTADAASSTSLDAGPNAPDASVISSDANAFDTGLVDQSAPDGDANAPQCGQTDSDSKNCGACGHDCLGGACMGGKCKPSTMIVSQGKPWAIKVDATNIYWTDISGSAGAIHRLPKLATLGAPITLATTTETNVYDLVLDETHAYFSSGSSSNGGVIERCPLDGGTKEAIVASSDPRGLSMDATHIYWVNTEPPTDVAGATKTVDAGTLTLAPLEDTPSLTFVDGPHIFWTLELVSSGAVRRCTLPACTDRTTVVGNIPNPKALATNSTLLFFAVDAAIRQIAKGADAGSGAVMASGQALPYAIVADDKDVVWINLGHSALNFSDGDIRRCPIVAGIAQCNTTGEVLASAPKLARGIAMDAKAIYWTSELEGAIYRLAR